MTRILKQIIPNTFKTISAIPVTPFRNSGEIDLDAYLGNVQRMIEGGIRAITLNGNTSEFYALSPDECRCIIEATGQGFANRAALTVGVGFDVTTATDTARFADRHGAVAVMIHQPVHPYQSADGWVAYHRAIADAVPELGVVPYVRDANVSRTMLQTLLDACPNVVAVKYAVPNPLSFAAIVQAIGTERTTWQCGLAEGWAPFFWLGGARGFTSGLVNVRADHSLTMLAALHSNDYATAMQIWAQVKPFEDLRARHGNANNVPVVKEAMAQLGLCGRAVRPPLIELDQIERAEVRALLAAWEEMQEVR